MASAHPPFGDEPSPASNAAESFASALRYRLSLLRGPQPEEAHTPPLRYFAVEALHLLNPLGTLMRRPLPVEKSSQTRIAVILPGFGTGPERMRYMAEQLERAGHKTKRWGLGHNLGPTAETIDILSDRVRECETRYGEKVVMIGWSLGGVFAREVAKQVPECIDKVITMGSPFSHSPYSNNMWRPYQFVAGHTVEAPPIPADTHIKPPVETVAFWSPRDGVISRRAACGLPGERDRAVALRCSHLTFPDAPECIAALLQELDPAKA